MVPVFYRTAPVLFEYLLCSHFGLQGTSRPTKYVVLKNENRLSADEMQKLSYYLCFTYARCNKSISIPTPVMYAHLAAYRSKLHLVAQNIETEGSERVETQENRRELEVRNAAIRSKLHIVAQDLDTQASERGETRQQREEREISSSSLNNNVKVNDALKARLYYC